MSISKDAKPLVIKWKYKTIHQKDNGTNSIDGYINYISEQVTAFMKVITTFMATFITHGKKKFVMMFAREWQKLA